MFENIASWALSLSLIIFNIKLAGCPKLLASETKWVTAKSALW
jgi:hypothetical protein